MSKIIKTPKHEIEDKNTAYYFRNYKVISNLGGLNVNHESLGEVSCDNHGSDNMRVYIGISEIGVYCIKCPSGYNSIRFVLNEQRK